MSDESTGRGPLVLVIGAVAVLLLIGVVFLVGHFTPAPVKAVEQALPMGSAEQAYVPQIEFLEPKVGRAQNFLNQEVTFVFGSVSNNGSQQIKQIEVTLEFHDLFNQVVLRDKQRLMGDGAAPIGPHEKRDIQISYETMPAQWNQAYPSVKITGLLLQ